MKVLLANENSATHPRQVRPAWTSAQHLLEGQAGHESTGEATSGDVDNAQYHDSAVWDHARNDNTSTQ